MRRKKILGLCVAAATFTLLLTTAFAQPGTSSDPLVSKSYVDDKINQVLTQLGGKPLTTTAPSSPNYTQDSPPVIDSSVSSSDVDAIANEVIERLNQYNDQQGGFVPVSLDAGQKLIGGEGAEIILRSGSARGYCPGENGLVDVSAGIEIFSEPIVTNHMIIVPRSDGRGVEAITGCWFIVKGGYDIK